jgi:predicted NBD/HSP70 family sugar kinase
MKIKPVLKSSEAVLVEVIYQQGQITRAELSRITGLSPTTIIRLVAELREHRLLVEGRDSADGSGRGRPSDTLRINPQAGYAVGLDFGEDRLTVVVTNAAGTIIHTQMATPPPFEPVPDTLDALVHTAQKVVESQGIGWEQVGAFSLALHDLVSADGDWIAWNNLMGTPFRAQQYLQDTLGIVTHVEDVSRAFAEAEYRYGAGQGTPDQIYVFIGSRGMGAGIFMNDTLMKSASGICGEIGHIVVDPGGQLCQCGNHGCLVTLCVTNVLVARCKSLLSQGLLSSLQNVDDLTFASICLAAENGDKVANLVLREAADLMAKALSSVVNILGTPLVIIGGQLTLAGPGFLNDLGSMLARQVIPSLAKNIIVKYAALPAYAGAWGGALQALDKAWMDGIFIRQNGIGAS